MTMLAYGLMNVNREALVPFFERVPELFHSHHHSEAQDSDGYEELLYRICRPYSSHTLDLIDEWMGFERSEWKVTPNVKFSCSSMRFDSLTHY